MRRTVDECKTLLQQAAGPALARAIEACSDDTRAGVQKMVASARRRADREDRERMRLVELLTFEASLRAQGYDVVAGLDEVGRGALAGPVTVAAVVLPPGTVITGLNDSKLLDPPTRSRIAAEVRSVATGYTIAHVAAHVIDAVGISKAVLHGMERALAQLVPSADHALTDGLRFGLSIPETSVVKGDSKVAAIAAASVIAKVARDEVMTRLGESYPGWAFDSNKGYGTSEHLSAIVDRGITHVHRRSFAPCTDDPTLF